MALAVVSVRPQRKGLGTASSELSACGLPTLYMSHSKPGLHEQEHPTPNTQQASETQNSAEAQGN